MDHPRRPVAAAAAFVTAAATALIAVPAVQVAAAPAVASSARPPVPVTHVYVTKHDRIRMDTSFRAGMREFVIDAANHSSFQVVKSRPGYSKKEAVRDIRRGLDQGSDLSALRRVERNLRFLGGVNAGPKHTGHFWRVMHAGRFWAVETTGDTTAAKILTFHVHGSEVPTKPVSTVGEIRAVRSVRWAHMPRAIPHAGVLGFTNDSSDNHVLVMVKLAKGKTIRDFRHWVNGGAQGRPPLGNKSFSFGVLSPTSHMMGAYSQPSGRYVLLCFWPDADHHGMPHFLMGMYRGVRLI
jgi:hypothetical protein